MTSLPKTMAKFRPLLTKEIIYHSKGIDKRYPKMSFSLNLRSCVKVMGIFVKFWLSFYDACSPNMVMSCDPRCKILKIFYFVLIPYLILGKVTKFLVESSLLRCYQQKTSWGGGGGRVQKTPCL